MRPTVITGMHRSGTSMVARAAAELGIHLGHPDDLVPAAPDNPDGFFEHRGLVDASELVFQELGAGWDCPPSLGPADVAGPGLAAARDLARPVLAELAAHEPWAWKDPRAAPVLPFWLDLVDGLGVVLCLRNPLEVAASLRTRNGTSLALGLRLWHQHMAAVLATDAPRLVTHYDAWFHRAGEEVTRLLAFVGIDDDGRDLTTATAVPARHRRHARFDGPALRTARLHPELRQLYERLCEEAAWLDGATVNAAANGDGAPHRVVATATSDDTPIGQVRPWIVDIGLARYEVHKRNGRVAQLEREVAAAPERSPAPVTSAADPEALRAAVYDLQLQVGELTARIVNGIDAETRAADIAYVRMIRALRRDVRRLVPADADVLVLADGEPALLDLHGRRARHFPAGASPIGSGPHPADGLEASALLVAEQARGATHLVVASTAAWWLDGYPELADRLALAATRLPATAEGSLVLQLHEPREPEVHADGPGAVDAARRRLGRDPHVLDATAAGCGPPGSFRPPEPTLALPYLDATIDVVVVDEDAAPEQMAEAERVAGSGVLTAGPSGWTWRWTAPPTAVDVDVVVTPPAAPVAYLDVLRSTLPAGATGSLTVAGDDLTAALTAGSAPHVALVDGSSIPLDGWLSALLTPFGRGATVGAVAARHTSDPAGGVVERVDSLAPGAVVWRRDVVAAHPLGDGPLAGALAEQCRSLGAAGLDCLVQPAAVVAGVAVGAGSSADPR